jgi:hypothetical protein
MDIFVNENIAMDFSVTQKCMRHIKFKYFICM